MTRPASGFALLSPCGHPYAGARLAVFPDFLAIFDLQNDILRRPFMAVFAERLVLAFIRAGKAAQEKAAVVLLGVGRQHPFRGPAQPMASQHGAVVDAGLLGPLHQAHGKPFVGHEDVAGGIVGLLFPSRPVAVLRAVGAVIVSAFKGVFVRRVAQIGQEHVKVVPSLADLDASAAVAVIMGRFGVVASGLHLDPNTVNSRIGQSVSFCHEPVITYRKELSNEL